MKGFPEPRQYSQYFSTAFRSLRLQILWQISRLRDSDEVKKTAIFKHRGAALLHIFLHAIPLAGSLTLVVLNLKPRFIGNVQVNGLTILQFAAKILEVSIQASIAAIVLALIRYYVLETSELPFGGVVAPYRVADVSFLWSLEFWGCLTAPRLRLKTRIIFCLVLPAAVILAALVGPSSAVLMIPRPMQYADLNKLILSDPADVLYPKSIELEQTSTLKGEESFNQTSAQTSLGFQYTWPVLVLDGFGQSALKFTSGNFDGLATIPGHVATMLNSDGGANFSAPQPYVYTDCHDSYTEVDVKGKFIDFGSVKPDLNNLFTTDMLMPNYTVSPQDESIAVHQIYSTNMITSMIWSKLPTGVSNNSLAMVVASSNPQENFTHFACIACTIDAYWATVNTNIRGSKGETGRSVETELPSTRLDAPKKVLLQLTNKTLISLTPKWAKRVSLLAIELNFVHYLNQPMFYAKEWQSWQYALALSYVSKSVTFTSGIFINRTFPYSLIWAPSFGLSERQHKDVLNYISTNKLLEQFTEIDVSTNPSTWTDPAELSQTRVIGWTSGYGYDASAITVKLALAVVLFYLVSTIVYLVYSVSTGYAATSWDSIAELVTLALNSERPTSLNNTSVGVDKVKTFRQTVKVGVNKTGSLELVFDAARRTQSTVYKDVVVNKRY